MFSTAGTTVIRSIGQAELGDRAGRLEHGGAARHVLLHQLHAGGGLDRDAAAVEGDALADQRRGSEPAPPPRVAQDDQRGSFAEPGGDREDPAHALGLELGAAEDLDLERVVGGGDLAGALGQVGGVGDVGGQVLQVAGAVGGLGGDAGDLDDLARRRRRRCRVSELEPRVGASSSPSLRLALEAVEAVGGEDRPGGQPGGGARPRPGRPRRSCVGVEARRPGGRRARRRPGPARCRSRRACRGRRRAPAPAARAGRTARLLSLASDVLGPGRVGQVGRAARRPRTGRRRAGRRRLLGCAVGELDLARSAPR